MYKLVQDIKLFEKKVPNLQVKQYSSIIRKNSIDFLALFHKVVSRICFKNKKGLKGTSVLFTKFKQASIFMYSLTKIKQILSLLPNAFTRLNFNV